MNPAPSRVPAPRPALAIAQPLNLTEAGRSILTPALTARQYFEALVAAGHNDDALRFLAAALPKRATVGWGHACLKGLEKSLPEAQAKALAATERWLQDATDGNRRAAGTAAEQAGYDNAYGALAAAVFWSGGSIAPQNVPTVAPRDDLTGQAVGVALIQAVYSDPDTTDTRRLQFLALGSDITSGKMKV